LPRISNFLDRWWETDYHGRTVEYRPIGVVFSVRATSSAAFVVSLIAARDRLETTPPSNSKSLSKSSMVQIRRHCSLIAPVAIVAAMLGYSSVRADDQPANASFSYPNNLNSLSTPLTQFGTYRQGNPGATLNINVYNLPAAAGTTSAMTLVQYPPSKVGDTDAIKLQTANIIGLQPAGTGGTPNAPMQLIFSTNQIGNNLQASYTLEFFSDTAAPTTPHESLLIAAYATVLRHGDYNADGKVDTGDYVVWRKTRGQNVSPRYSQADDDGDGRVTDDDYTAWRAAYTGTFGSGSSDLSGPTGVPEPATAILALFGAAFIASLSRKRNRTAVK
jgi:hypothetical protein